MRLKPVVRIFPSERNTALIGLVPSWTFSFTWENKNRTLQIGKPQHPHARHNSFVWQETWHHLEDGAPSRVDDTQSLVLADGADGTAVLVPADTVNEVRVGVVQLVHKLPRAHVPHTNHVIAAWREEDTAPTDSLSLRWKPSIRLDHVYVLNCDQIVTALVNSWILNVHLQFSVVFPLTFVYKVC